jgi:hypothetical protein
MILISDKLLMQPLESAQNLVLITYLDHCPKISTALYPSKKPKQIQTIWDGGVPSSQTTNRTTHES